MELYERELQDAEKRIEAAGKSATDFVFERTFQEPDPDGGGMFTVRYDVAATFIPTDKRFVSVGGIGLRWVDEFAYAMQEGFFES